MEYRGHAVPAGAGGAGAAPGHAGGAYQRTPRSSYTPSGAGVGAGAGSVPGQYAPQASAASSPPSQPDDKYAKRGAAPPSPGRARRTSSVDAREQTKAWLRRNSTNVILWFSLIVAIIFFYHLMSDGDFSFLLTLGSLIRTFAFMTLVFKVVTTKSVRSLSLKMCELYALTFLFRLSSILFYEGYLPFDRSGDYLYRGAEIIAFLCSVTLIVMISVVYKDQYDSELDVFGRLMGMPNSLGIIWIVVPAFFLAWIFHPSLNSNWVTDTAWTLGLAIESCAVLPQIVMFIRFLSAQKKNRSGEALESWTSHVVAALGMARLIHLLFWLSSYSELNDKFNESPGGAHVGHFVVLSQIVQLLLMCDYLYYYVKAMQSGKDIAVELSKSWSGAGAENFV